MAAAADAQTTASSAVVHAAAGSRFTRGIGMYPGAPDENFAPELVLDTTTYRNLALRRPASHSSSYDYNLTAQLVTDGIRDTNPPQWVAVTTSSQGKLPKTDREILLNHSHVNMLTLEGAHAWVEVSSAAAWRLRRSIGWRSSW
jgi:hypothetical protein